MAKTTPAETVADTAPEATTTPTIFGELVDIAEPETKNKYDDTVAAMIEAGKGIVLPVPNDRIAIELRYFRQSANAADKTAKEVARVVDGGVTKISLKLVPKYNKTKKGDDTPDAASEHTELDGIDAAPEAETPAV